MVNYLNPNIHWRARIRGLGPKDQLGCLHGILFLLLAAALLVVAAMFAGCTTTQYVPVPEYHTDTTYVTIQQIAEALGMTVAIVDERLRDLAPLRVLTAE